MSDYTLWTDASGKRFFLMADDDEPRKGNFVLRAINRDQPELRVNPTVLAACEITAAEAREYWARDLQASLEQARQAWLGALRFAETAATEVEVTPEPGNIESLQTGLLKLVSVVRETLLAATSDDPAQAEKARAQLRALREDWREGAHGIELPAAMEQLPEQLWRWRVLRRRDPRSQDEPLDAAMQDELNRQLATLQNLIEALRVSPPERAGQSRVEAWRDWLDEKTGGALTLHVEARDAELRKERERSARENARRGVEALRAGKPVLPDFKKLMDDIRKEQDEQYGKP
jgi:hypothetical protein